MCDYSLHHVATRPARIEDKLVTTKFSNSNLLGIPPDDFRQRANIIHFMDCSEAPMRFVVDPNIREHNPVMTVAGDKPSMVMRRPHRFVGANSDDSD